MTLLDSIKPFWPLLFTIALPRALGYYQALKTAYRTRPPARPLPTKAVRCLNILLASTCLFIWMSVRPGPMWQYRSLFTRTQTRLHVPTDILFSRLASSRPDGTLTALDEELRLKLLTVPSRQIYLRYGPETLLNCSFCHVEQPMTYLLHYLPTNILLPHLLHLVSVGLTTSRSVSGATASQFRLKMVVASLALLLLDIYIVTTVDLPAPTPSHPSPSSLYLGLYIGRPVALALSDMALAALVYVTATGRFIFFPFLASAADPDSAGDPDEVLGTTNKLLTETGVALQMAHMKLRGLNVARNSIARDESLKLTDAAYWATVRTVEGQDPTSATATAALDDETILEDEDVQAAMARAFGSGNVDVEKMRREARTFVDNVTRGLDRRGDVTTGTTSH